MPTTAHVQEAPRALALASRVLPPATRLVSDLAGWNHMDWGTHLCVVLLPALEVIRGCGRGRSPKAEKVKQHVVCVFKTHLCVVLLPTFEVIRGCERGRPLKAETVK